MDYKTVISLSLVFILCKQYTTALKCYLCQVDTHAVCSNFTDCAPDELCWLKSITLSSGDARYKSGCEKKALCPQPTIVGRRSLVKGHLDKRATTKQFCCTTDYCNGPPMTVAPPTTTASTPSSTLGSQTTLCARILKSHANFAGSLFTDYQNKCYEIPTLYNMDWDSASHYCRYFGGQLLTIDNYPEKTFILTYLKKTYKHSVWIATTSVPSGGTPGSQSGSSTWFSHFRHFYPWTQKTCPVLTVTGMEQSLGCSSSHFFVCEYAGKGTRLSTVPTTQSAVSSAGIAVPGKTNLCPSTISAQAKTDNAYLGYFNNSCYEFITKRRETYDDALAMCQMRGGQLVDILNSQEQDFVQKFLVRYDPTNAVWIGLQDFTNGYHGRWASGAPVQYINWIANKQRNMFEKCSVILPYSNGKWDFTFCGYIGWFVTEQHPVLCEYKLQNYTGK